MPHQPCDLTQRISNFPAELLKRKKMGSASFIPLEAPGATRFGVVPLKNLNNDGNRLAAIPKDFRSQMLYGNRVTRVPSKYAFFPSQSLQSLRKG